MACKNAWKKGSGTGMTDYKTLVKAYRAYLIALTAMALAALLIFWLLRGYGGNADVGKTITDIKMTAAQNERRVEMIFDRKNKEEALANEKITEKLRTVSDDDLPDLLAGLLSEWRAEKRHR